MNTRAGPTPSGRPFPSLPSIKSNDAIIDTSNVAQHPATFPSPHHTRTDRRVRPSEGGAGVRGRAPLTAHDS